MGSVPAGRTRRRDANGFAPIVGYALGPSPAACRQAAAQRGPRMRFSNLCAHGVFMDEIDGRLFQGLDPFDILGFSQHDEDVAVLYDKAGGRYQNEVFGHEFFDGNHVDVVFGSQIEVA